MNRKRLMAVLSPLVMVGAIILLLHDVLAGEITSVNSYCHGGLLVAGVYLLYSTHKQQRRLGNFATKASVPLTWFVILSASGLLVSFSLLYVIEGYPIWMVTLSLGITAFFYWQFILPYGNCAPGDIDHTLVLEW